MIFRPKHDLASAVKLLVEGLEDGSVVLGRDRGQTPQEQAMSHGSAVLPGTPAAPHDARVAHADKPLSETPAT